MTRNEKQLLAGLASRTETAARDHLAAVQKLVVLVHLAKRKDSTTTALGIVKRTEETITDGLTAIHRLRDLRDAAARIHTREGGE